MFDLAGSLFMVVFALTNAEARPSTANRSVTVQNASGESIEFRIEVEDDGALTIQPQLQPGQEGSILGLSFDRTRPARLLIPNYRAREIFRLGDDLWVTLSDDVRPNERYLAKLMPRLERVTTGTLAKQLVPSGLSVFGVLFNGAAYMQMGNGLFLALAAGHAILEGVCRITDVVCEFKNRVTKVETKGVHANPYGDRLRVLRYVYNPDWSIQDVIVKTHEGWTYSLKTGFRCGSILTGLAQAAG